MLSAIRATLSIQSGSYSHKRSICRHKGSKGADGESQRLCGISGYTHRRGVFDPTVIRRSTASLIHRGPDQQAVHESRLVSLGAVRLQIIDLDGGAQPCRRPDGDTSLIFNGEIYTYR